MADIMESSNPQTAPSRPLPLREDCWSEEATSTLVDAWGRRFLELNRGNLRQKDWQEVAEAVNACHGHTKKTRRTDVQCKNRIDTLKKKYKTEKAKIADESSGILTSSWPFFQRLDSLIGSTSAAAAKPQHQLLKSSPLPSPISYSLPSPPMAVPLPYARKFPSLSPVILPQKRPSSMSDDAFFRRNYSALAAAAAKEESEEADESDDESLGMSEENEKQGRGMDDGIKKLAKAIERFGEIYQMVESDRQSQMVELEKQRMQFAKDLEVQRMKLFMDTQVQLEKMKQANKRSFGSDDLYS